MKMRWVLMIGCLAPLWLNGCGGDDDDGVNGNGNAFLDVFNRDANSAPVEYGNPDPLQSDIQALFGDANSVPKDPDKVLD